MFAGKEEKRLPLDKGKEIFYTYVVERTGKMGKFN